MANARTTIIQDRKRTRVAEFSGIVKKSGLSKYSVFNVLTEPFLVGFSLFLAFLVQQTYFSINSRQFLIGQGELVRMSLGISFCYAFIYVLRRGYRWALNSPAKDTAKKLGQYIVETHVLYLALLFLVKDINFTSIKLALGISLIASAILVFSCRFAYLSIRTGEKSPSRHRKITLKKASSFSDLKSSSRPSGNNGEDRNILREDDSKMGRLTNNGPIKNSAGD
ncbi:MAG: hypothetical protein JSU85_12890 [Candidatus Zixiibacteriota bacterium]|nr:MAG: hypothetical protein JSU85_12890 [candidate division Zixibacteria bacterium]